MSFEDLNHAINSLESTARNLAIGCQQPEACDIWNAIDQAKAAIGVDIREVYSEAKGNGFDGDPTDAIKLSHVKTREEALDYVREEFMDGDPLGTGTVVLQVIGRFEIASYVSEVTNVQS